VNETDRTLAAEVASLRDAVEQLRAQLAEVKTHVAPTMKKQLRCPACNGTRIAHANYIPDQTAHGITVLALGPVKGVGALEAFACTTCGLVEFYAAVPGSLREIKNTIVIHDPGTPESGPYR
jgi:hypothetical protein